MSRRNFFAPPVFEDEEKSRLAALLNDILLIYIALTVLGRQSSAVGDALSSSEKMHYRSGVCSHPDRAVFLLRRGYVSANWFANRQHHHRNHRL
jgi:hypothetical protein